jgi:hypothetical protein
MNPIAAAITSIGLTSHRAFLPAFVAAVLLRWGADSEMAREAGQQLLGTANVASWFTSNISLWVLGALALLECIAERNPEAKAVLAEVDHYVKPVMAAVLQLGLLSTADAETISKITAATQQASVLGTILLPAVMLMTYLAASARNAVQRLLLDADPDNSTGLHRLLGWAEELYSVLGMALFLLFPILIAALVGIVLAGLFLLQRRARRIEDASRVPCGSCGNEVYRCAPHCPQCSATQPAPRSIGFLGQSTASPADPETHPLDLLAKRRCPWCAGRFPSRDPEAACPACQRRPFADAATLDAYDNRLALRLIPTVLIASALSLVPVVGLVAAVVFYRVYLISPYRTWLPTVRSVLTRWLLRLAILLLVLLHLIPVVGAAAAGAMVLLNYLVYRQSFLSSLANAPAVSARPPPLARV